MPLPGELTHTRRTGGDELDRIDDELFSIDYRSPTQARHLTLLPEPPTVRLAQRAPVTRPGVGLYRPVYAPASTAGPWTGMGTCPASEYSPDENGAEIVLLVGIAVLLVVAVASTGVVLWWIA